MPQYKVHGTRESTNLGFEASVEASNPASAVVQFFEDVGEETPKERPANVRDIIEAVDAEEYHVEEIVEVLR